MTALDPERLAALDRGYRTLAMIGVASMAVLAALYAFMLATLASEGGWAIAPADVTLPVALFAVSVAVPLALCAAAALVMGRVFPGRARAQGMIAAVITLVTVVLGASCMLPMTLGLVAAVLTRSWPTILPFYGLSAAAPFAIVPRFDRWVRWAAHLESPSVQEAFDARRDARAELGRDREALRAYRGALITTGVAAAMSAALFGAGFAFSGAIVNAGPRLTLYRAILGAFALLAPLEARIVLQLLRAPLASAADPVKQVSSLVGLLVALPVLPSLMGAVAVFFGGSWPDLAIFGGGAVALWAWIVPTRPRFLGWIRMRQGI